MSETTDSAALVEELLGLALQLEDYDPPGAFSLREEAGFFTEISFRLPVHLKSGRVSLIEALKLSHGPPAGRFLIATSAVPAPSRQDIRYACLERTLKACLHGLDWRGAEIQVRCDPRELSPEVRASIGSALATEAEKHATEAVSEFVLPWRRLPARVASETDDIDPDASEDTLALLAAQRMSITSAFDLYENSLLNIFPTACASRGIRMDDCTTLVKGRGSWAFRVAERINSSYGSPVRVELAGRRYRPSQSRSAPAHPQRGPQQQGRWETDERDAGNHPEVLILLGGSEPITAEGASAIKSCLLFHVHRESLTSEGEKALREKGIVVVPHLVLCSMEILAADSLAAPGAAARLTQLTADDFAEAEQELRSGWRHRLLAAWDRVLAKTKEEQCSAHEAVVRLAASGLVQFSRNRLDIAQFPPNASEDPAA